MTTETTFTCSTIQQLNGLQMLEILELRSKVFVIEQQCIYQDPDHFDGLPDTRHLCAWQNGQLAGYLRVLPPRSTYDEPSLGRVVVDPAFRGQGLAQQLVQRGLEELYAFWPSTDVVIGAQVYLQKFYASLGFVAEGDAYIEDGIPHITMRRQLK
ncbi:GNAT family N-acetyltransferase [Leeia oryzae]|uniref:GNAT family N-acetyltransferase n=1 Tax=Leeia oryzae TaxID=356662 RepID=UPI00036D4C1D|nr:GNAT family N-acetyltransferase [Leeia oryzae]